MLTPSTPISDLSRVGKSAAGKLKRLNIKTVADLLWYLPIRYDDLTEVKKIADITDEERVTVKGVVTLLQSKRSFRHRMSVTELQLEDDSGSIQAVWFRQPYVAKTLAIGDEIYLSGKAKKHLLGFQLNNPLYEKVKDEQIHTGRITPLYKLTQGLSHKQLRFLIHEALPAADRMLDELPSIIRVEEQFPNLADSLNQIHFPDSWAELDDAERRLKFEELFWLQIRVLQNHRELIQQKARAIPDNESVVQAFIASLPFELTTDQQTAIMEINRDLTLGHPMNRLLQGDVGSGKTVVALAASTLVASAGHQVAVMAATEILARQHFNTMLKFLPQIPVALLTSKQALLGEDGKFGEVTKKNILKIIADGHVHVVIGTHSLIQEKVSYHDLALAVIDEQHRFGVEQRKKLKQAAPRGLSPHLLSLTATPIPRTLALTLYGDLNISLIKAKPADRKITVTKVVSESNRAKAYDWILKRIEQGEQLFVVCPMVEASDKLQVKSVMQEYEKLQKEIYPQLEISYLHGKMTSADKEATIHAFRNKDFPILVASSVVEVGIDIPGATMMIIEGAERFGLSQLHQFRGRIGRNDLPSYCFLFTTNPSQQDNERLKAMTEHHDGFELAEIDLQLRGAGDVFGTQQSGLVDLQVAKLSDTAIIKNARDWATKVLNEEPFISDRALQDTIRERREETHWE